MEMILGVGIFLLGVFSGAVLYGAGVKAGEEK